MSFLNRFFSQKRLRCLLWTYHDNTIVTFGSDVFSECLYRIFRSNRGMSNRNDGEDLPPFFTRERRSKKSTKDNVQAYPA